MDAARLVARRRGTTIMHHRGTPQQQNQLRGKKAPPSQVVTAEGARTQKCADQEAGRDQRPGSEFVGAGRDRATHEPPQPHPADGEKESEFQPIVDGQEDGIGDAQREWRLQAMPAYRVRSIPMLNRRSANSMNAPPAAGVPIPALPGPRRSMRYESPTAAPPHPRSRTLLSPANPSARSTPAAKEPLQPQT